MSGGDLEVGDQAAGAVPGIVSFQPLAVSGLRGEIGVVAFDGLDAGLFINTDEPDAVFMQGEGALIPLTQPLHSRSILFWILQFIL